MEFHGVHIPQDKLQAFCHRHGVARLSLFGSILTDHYRPESDVDVLIEFLPGMTPGLFRFAGMELELRGLIGRTVHLCTPGDLSKYIRDRILREAKVQYAA